MVGNGPPVGRRSDVRPPAAPPTTQPTSAANIPVCCMPASGFFVLHVEHRPPDGEPRAALLLEHPQIPTRGTEPFAGTLVEHLIPKADHRCITRDIDLTIMLAEVMNDRVLAEIAEPRKEWLPSL